MLYISSINLHSWTTTTLPYRLMSLTTYQSKFVVVGGRHPSTIERTNLLFTSDTGLQWKPSLPPMPTKRSSTSSVCIESPEVLVVAGGYSLSMELDVVELLLGDQWNTVEPLPVHDYGMHSTLHDGNLYFTGGWQYNTVCTCSCTSLISSCGNNTTTDRPLWRQFWAPHTSTAVVSYCSRLVSIGGYCSISAYSSMSQSWVEATTTGDNFDIYANSVAAAVLSTEELVFAHAYGGVFRLKLTGD